MNFKRIIANTIVRRLTLLVLATVLAWLGLGDASAQIPPNPCPDHASGCNIQAAHQACSARAAYVASAGHFINNDCVANHSTGWIRLESCWGNGTGPSRCTAGNVGVYWFAWVDGCPAGQIWNDLVGQKRCMTNCTDRANSTFKPVAGQMIPNGSIGCSDGCAYAVVSNGDGTYTRGFLTNNPTDHCSVIPNCANFPGTTFNAGLGMCQTPPAQCAPNQIKDPLTGMCRDGCPVGQIMDPNGLCNSDNDACPPGHIRGPDGTCTENTDPGSCPAGYAKKPDGTCGRDTDGDGVPDEYQPGDDVSFSGGDNCDVPPSCTGDPIMCGQARIQWRIDCNTRANIKIAGGTCDSMPICTGPNCNAMEHAQLIMMWRTSCKTDAVATALAQSSGNGDDDQTSVPYDPGLDAEGVVDAYAGTGEPGDAFTDQSANNGGAGGAPGGTGELDTSGFGWSSSCPNLPSINVLGTTLDFNSAGNVLCPWFQLGGQIVLILAALVSLRILSGGGSV